MATNDMADLDEGEQCRKALDAAASVALDYCGDEQQIKDQLSSLVGVEPDVDADAALEEGLDAATCQSFRGVRQWVFARGHQLINEEEMSFSDAMDRAWSEAHEQCADIGHSL